MVYASIWSSVENAGTATESRMQAGCWRRPENQNLRVKDSVDEKKYF